MTEPRNILFTASARIQVIIHFNLNIPNKFRFHSVANPPRAIEKISSGFYLSYFALHFDHHEMIYQKFIAISPLFVRVPILEI